MRKERILVIAGIMLAIFLSALDQTVVSTAIPKIVQDLGGLRYFSWIFSAYMLTFVASIMIIGRLSDIYGRKPTFVAGVVIFLVGSVLCGFSSNIWELIIFRGIQGIGAGSIMVNSMATIADIFPPAERGRYQGLIGSMFALASIIGPAVGGFLTDAISWHWIFFINVPIGIFAVIALSSSLPPSKKHQHNIDFIGSGFMTLSITLLVLVMILGGGPGWEFLSGRTISLLAASLISFALFIYVESKVKEPIMPLYIFKNEILVVSIISIFFLAANMMGGISLLPIFFQNIMGKTATSSGFLLVPFTLATAGSSAISGQIIARTGKYKTLSTAGLFIGLIGAGLMATITENTSELLIILYTSILGIGMGTNFPTMTIAVQNAFDRNHIGIATSAIQFFRTLGGMFGVTLFGAVINAAILSEHAEKATLSSSIHTAFVFGAVLALTGFIAALFLKELPLRKTHEEPVLVEMGVEAAAEEGLFPEEYEPRLRK